ncbi:MAG TPA: conjugal transfer protein MobC [Candidatus Babeliaceae bacterium]|nr:conjugal transfer protein MobC [Candidatus Babeliaceae bacterium]
MQTGENEQGLRKIMDLTRIISVTVLLLHFYFTCYKAFLDWHLTSKITDRLLQNIAHTGLFAGFHKAKLIALGFLAISMIGVKGRKDEKITFRKALMYLASGLLFYFASFAVLYLTMDSKTITIFYIVVTGTGYLSFMAGGGFLSRIIKDKLSGDIFNANNETFPQEERLLQNEFSINLPAQYNFKGKRRKSWINFINPFRGLLVLGSPGSGKSYFVIQHIIKQHIQKGFSMFVYDFKYDDLTKITYNQYLLYKHKYIVEPKFYVINFDDLSRSHRCNPLDINSMNDITDAAESSRTIMLGLNREWITKQGNFFVESPINFVTALIWFLRRYKNGQFCTLPHVIELAQVDYQKLFSILRTDSQIEVLVNPFVSAYMNNANEQLEGQIASAKISLAKLVSPQLYYILSGNDFTLDINNPKEPKIVCMGNNPQKSQTYGAVLSLYITTLIRLINRKNCLKSSLIFDEFPTIYFNGMDSLVATARSNKVATALAVQDYSQLKKDYGQNQAEVIMNIVGNIISGQVSGDTARQLSERFGKIMQDRQSLSINSQDTSITKSQQLENAIPASKIASLSSGEFVGVMADNPEQKIALKMFCSEIINDHKLLATEQNKYRDLPEISQVNNELILNNYQQVKTDIEILIQSEIERMMDTPEMTNAIVKK